MSTGLESYQDRPLYQLSYPNLVFFKISELCRPWIYHKKYLTLYYFWPSPYSGYQNKYSGVQIVFNTVVPSISQDIQRVTKHAIYH